MGRHGLGLAILIVAVCIARLAEAQIVLEDSPGFPIQEYWSGNERIADLDADGALEIITRVNAYDIRALDADGQQRWAFVTPAPIDGHPCTGNLDDDPFAEVVVLAWGGSGVDNLFAIDQDGTLMPGWPVYYPNTASLANLALGDLDGDGIDEVVICGGSGDIYAYDRYGQYVDGWPQPTTEAIAGLSVGDVDFDGAAEVVVTTITYTVGWQPSPVYVFNGDGSLVSGWPSIPATGWGYMNDPPVIADLDGDLSAEIIGIGAGGLMIMNADGSMFMDHSVPLPWGIYEFPAVGDLDGDGWLEVVAASDELAIYWPRTDTTTQTEEGGYSAYRSPRIADVDGDGEAEIVVWTRNIGPVKQATLQATLHVLNAKLEPEPWWPGWQDPIADMAGSLEIADLDGDGDVELLLHSTPLPPHFHSLDLPNPGAFPPRVEWGVLAGPKLASWYHSGDDTPSGDFTRGDANLDGDVGLADAVTMLTILFGPEFDNPCMARFDVNNSGDYDLADAVYLLTHLFVGGAAPPVGPYPTCGPVPLASLLPCTVSTCP